MKNVNELRKLFFACMVVGSTVVLSSCSDDDDENTPTPPSVTDVYGDYSGKMLVTPLEKPVLFEAEEPAGTDIAAVVKSDTVYFNDFPIDDIVKSIITDEDAAAKIIEQIGRIDYKVGYKGSLNAAQDSIYMVFDPKPLSITLPGEGEETTTVEVTITASEKGSYELSSKKLNFDLNADKVTLGGEDLPVFEASEFAFKLNKK